MLLDRNIDADSFRWTLLVDCVYALTGPFGSGAAAAAAGDMTYQLAADSLCNEGMSRQQAAVAATWRWTARGLRDAWASGVRVRTGVGVPLQKQQAHLGDTAVRSSEKRTSTCAAATFIKMGHLIED